LQAGGYQSLVINRGDTNAVQDDAEIVRDDAISSPLRKDAQTNTDEQTVAVAWGGPQVVPGGELLGFFLGLEGLLNLRHLELDQRMFDVPTDVDVG
jgi:hypothetical protein